MNESREDFYTAMYGNNDLTDSIDTEEPVNEVRAISSKVMVLIEVNGKKHKLPTFSAVNNLIKENVELKRELRKTQRDLKKVIETIRHMSKDLDSVEDGLKNKIDKIDR